MDYSTEEDSDISDSEILDHIDGPYDELKSGNYKVKGPNGSLRCASCTGKKEQDYSYEELSPHAAGVDEGSANRRGKRKAYHLALAKYLETDLASEADQAQRRHRIREKEEALSKILELEQQLDGKQKLEMEIEELTGIVEVMKHLEDQDDEAVEEKMEEINDEPKEKEDELTNLEDLNSALISEERQSNDKLQEARKELIC
ncbi:hypothetical protein NL676_026663 [Syzygium grande]|nr:hypothetical protein NL676_026663 [Syzygium grande]